MWGQLRPNQDWPDNQGLLDIQSISVWKMPEAPADFRPGLD